MTRRTNRLGRLFAVISAIAVAILLSVTALSDELDSGSRAAPKEVAFGTYTNPINRTGYDVQLAWKNVTLRNIDAINPDSPGLYADTAPMTFSSPIFSGDNPYHSPLFAYVNTSSDLVVSFVVNGTVSFVHSWVPLYIDFAFSNEEVNSLYHPITTPQGELAAVWTVGIPEGGFFGANAPIYVEMYDFLSGSYVLFNTSITYYDWTDGSPDNALPIEDYVGAVSDNGWFAMNANASGSQYALFANWTLVDVYTGERLTEPGYRSPYLQSNSVSFIPDYGIIETDEEGANGTELFQFAQFNETTLSVLYANETVSSPAITGSDWNNEPLYYSVLSNGTIVYEGFYELDNVGAGLALQQDGGREYGGISIYQSGPSILGIDRATLSAFKTALPLDSNQMGIGTYRTDSGYAFQGTGSLGQPFYNLLNFTSISGAGNSSWIDGNAIAAGSLFQDRVAIGVTADVSGYVSYFVNETSTSFTTEHLTLYWIPQYTSWSAP
jgi:hypothetical protein